MIISYESERIYKMDIKNIKEYNPVYHKDCTLSWLKIGEKVGNHIREKKTYPSIGLE